MTGRSDPTYPQLVKALNLLSESKAKIEFLSSKIDNRLTDLEDEQLSHVVERSVSLGEPLNGSNQSAKWKISKDKADSLLRSLAACKEKCDALQGRVQRLIEVKDAILCQSINLETAPSNKELLPDGTRAERMKLELSRESSECSICTEIVKKTDAIWSCKNCFNYYHLQCIGKCMQASRNHGNKWNCPTCRLVMDVVPGGLRYTCFCGRVTSPKYAPDVIPHCCGQKCPRCPELCHPGPCSSTP